MVEASLRGRLKRDLPPEDRIVAGDRVDLELDDGGGWTIESVRPRSSRLVRAGPRGRKPKVVAANVDRMAAVLSAARPAWRAEVADRFLVLAELSGIEPVLIVNKMDLCTDPAEFERPVRGRFAGSGYDIRFVSAEDGRGIEPLRELLASGTTLLAGPSGVGKSSLLNAVAPKLSLRIGAVSRRQGRGRHTTVSARLVELPAGGWVVDTPGFSEVVFWEVDPTDLAHAFPEFRSLAPECRFRVCSHLHEPGCAVRASLEAGELDESRFESYRKLVQAL